MDGNGLFHRGVKNHQRAAGLLVVLLFCTNCIQPTGNLDSKSGSEVMELLQNVWKKMGTKLVVITHDSRVAQMADRQFVIVDGVLSEVTAR